MPVGLEGKIIKKYSIPRAFDFKPLDHIQIGEKLNIIDFESGTKVAGPKFYFLKNQAVLLQHAIKSFIFRKAIENGFSCLSTPDLAKDSILKGIGFSPRGPSSNTYKIEDADLNLIATAEIAVGGMYSNCILAKEQLPLLFVAESHCFRKEAGSAGQQGKGLYRVHQFEKIELFGISLPEDSQNIHQKILDLEESIYQDLDIPYQVLLNPSEDLGNPAYKKYDIEAWMPGLSDNGSYGEITSASNCTDYQARRLNIKYKDEDGKNKYIHTLNGTASALSRTLIIILENYQTEDGNVRIPDVLIPFYGKEFLI